MEFDYLSSNWFKLFKKQWFLSVTVTNLVLNAVFWLLLIARALPTTESVPLHYSLTFGIDWLGSWGNLFIYPVLGFLLICINTYLATLVQSINKFLSVVLVLLPAFAHIIVGVSVYMLLRNYY